jgi:hypothetical protein
VLPMADPTARFVSWALAQLPAHLAERGRAAGYKYLVEWLADVTAVQLYQRPDGAAGPLYDAATVAADGRLLHLVRRVARADEAVLQRFVADVTATKTARLKTGDIGGAILVAGSLTPELAQAQRQAKSTSSSGRWFAVEESFTGYEGFLRVGPRRGFHLLVVEETPDGYRPVLG